MSALRKTSVVHEYPVAAKTVKPVLSLVAAKVPATPVAQDEAAPKGGTLKNMLLFLSAPFVGLLYAVLLPFVGLGMLAWIGGEALLEQAATRKVLGYGKFMLKLVAAPFAGLAYILVFPFVGLAMLAWFGGAALLAPAPGA